MYAVLHESGLAWYQKDYNFYDTEEEAVNSIKDTMKPGDVISFAKVTRRLSMQASVQDEPV